MTTSYQFYTALLTKVVTGTASPQERATAANFEAAHPPARDARCRCGARVWTVCDPARVTHDTKDCHDEAKGHAARAKAPGRGAARR